MKEKTRKVFKGLDDDDYFILRFFYTEKGASRYKAKCYFEGEEEHKPIKRIPRATLYNRVKKLKDKGFLEVIGHGKFQRGPLTKDIEILRSQTVKGNFAVFGSGINPHDVLVEPSSTDKAVSIVVEKGTSYERMFEFYNNIFDSVIEMNEDLTDLKGNLNFIHYLNTLLLLKRPDYLHRFIQKSCVEPLDFDVRRMANEITKVSKLIEKDMKR